MKRRSRAVATLGVVLVLLVAAILALLGTGYGREFGDRALERGPAAQVSDLQNVGQLRDAFNREDGSARLVLLFSPT